MSWCRVGHTYPYIRISWYCTWYLAWFWEYLVFPKIRYNHKGVFPISGHTWYQVIADIWSYLILGYTWYLVQWKNDPILGPIPGFTDIGAYVLILGYETRIQMLEIAPFGTYFGSSTSHVQISTRLTGTSTAMAGQVECSDSYYPTTSTGRDLGLLSHQTKYAAASGFRTASLVSVKILWSWGS